MNTVVDIAEKYCIRTFNDKLKHFENILSVTKDVYDDILREIFGMYELTWLHTYQSTPYPYVVVPENSSLVLGLFTEDSCGLLQTVFRTQRFSTLPKPTTK